MKKKNSCTYDAVEKLQSISFLQVAFVLKRIIGFRGSLGSSYGIFKMASLILIPTRVYAPWVIKPILHCEAPQNRSAKRVYGLKVGGCKV